MINGNPAKPVNLKIHRKDVKTPFRYPKTSLVALGVVAATRVPDVWLNTHTIVAYSWIRTNWKSFVRDIP